MTMPTNSGGRERWHKPGHTEACRMYQGVGCVCDVVARKTTPLPEPPQGELAADEFTKVVREALQVSFNYGYKIGELGAVNPGYVPNAELASIQASTVKLLESIELEIHNKAKIEYPPFGNPGERCVVVIDHVGAAFLKARRIAMSKSNQEEQVRDEITRIHCNIITHWLNKDAPGKPYAEYEAEDKADIVKLVEREVAAARREARAE